MNDQERLEERTLNEQDRQTGAAITRHIWGALLSSNRTPRSILIKDRGDSVLLVVRCLDADGLARVAFVQGSDAGSSLRRLHALAYRDDLKWKEDKPWSPA